MSEWLWAELHYLFDTDDGSLPRVNLNYRDPLAVVNGFAYLRRLGTDVTYRGASYWSVTQSQERPLDSVPNAAELVLSGQAEPFHFVLRGIAVDGAVLPDLGIFVYDRGIDFDYRMGIEWRAHELEAFFGLLLKLTRLDSNSSVALEDHVLPEVAAQFQRCWKRFIDEKAA